MLSGGPAGGYVNYEINWPSGYRGVPYTHKWCVVEELEDEPTVAASVEIWAKTVSQKFCFGRYTKELLFNLQISCKPYTQWY